jgi:AraC-like DNA-binding protein
VLLTAAGIRPALLRINASRISPEQYSRLWRSDIEHLGDEFFGQDPRRMKPGSFALLCRSVVHCADLERALVRASRFFDVFLDEHGLEICRRAACPADVSARGTGRARPFGHETLLVIAHGLACWLVGRRIPILAADFAYPPPAHAAEYRDLFGPQSSFSSAGDVPRVLIVLSQPAGGADRGDRQGIPEPGAGQHPAQIQEHPELVDPDPASATADSSRTTCPDLEQVAREMNAAPATLRRKLKAEGQTYQGIKDDLRRDLAITDLSETDLSIRTSRWPSGFSSQAPSTGPFASGRRPPRAAYRR